MHSYIHTYIRCIHIQHKQYLIESVCFNLPNYSMVSEKFVNALINYKYVMCLCCCAPPCAALRYFYSRMVWTILQLRVVVVGQVDVVLHGIHVVQRLERAQGGHVLLEVLRQVRSC